MAIALGERVVIVHNHVLKNAGSTIDWALERNFGRRFVDHRDDKGMASGPAYLRKYLIDNDWLQAISSHHLALPLPDIPSTRLLSIMMFRDPIERVTSVYNFERSQLDDSTRGSRIAKKHTVRDYILWRLRWYVGPTIRNFHIYRTPPSPRLRFRLRQKDLESAKRYIETVECLGLVERFDESMVLFEETLRPFFPDIDLTYQAQNVGQDSTVSSQTRIRRLADEIGDETFHLLERHNSLDKQLYLHAKRVFEKRLRSCTRLHERVNEFRHRCRMVANQQAKSCSA